MQFRSLEACYNKKILYVRHTPIQSFITRMLFIKIDTIIFANDREDVTIESKACKYCNSILQLQTLEKLDETSPS
jgi:hypothetical protein